MNLEYLKNVIIPQREKEIAEGKNAATRQPIYVVLDLCCFFVSGHSDYSASINCKGKPYEYGYIDEAECYEAREFKADKAQAIRPQEVTKIYFDRVVAFFLTRKAAEEYMEYQAHNLENPYLYVFYSGYGNKEMDNLLSTPSSI